MNGKGGPGRSTAFLVEELELHTRRLGVRARRRWLNDRLIRELAQPLAAEDIPGLFAPAPFGRPRQSAFAKALSTRGALEALEADLDADHHQLSASQTAQTTLTSEAASWARIGARGRAVLRLARCRVPEFLRLHDDALHAFTTQEEGSSLTLPTDLLAMGAAAAAGSEDAADVAALTSFERLIVHSLASFYSLRSRSLPAADGRARVLCTRTPAVVQLQPFCEWLSDGDRQ